MKRISLIFTTLLLALILVACTSDKNFYAKVTIEDIEHELKAITFDLKIEDPDEQLEGNLIVYAFEGEKELSKKDIDVSNGNNLADIRFTNLTEGTQYTFVVNGTYLGKPKELLKRNISTRKAETKEVRTVDEFLSMNDNYSKYVLVNDLDFEGVVQSKRLSTFRVEFDGGGHTIKNYVLQTNYTNTGLFGSLSSDAKVHNFTIDNLTIEQERLIRTSTYTGLLVGRISSNNVEVDNITIKNSKINYSVDSNSNSTTVRVGMLAGAARGKITNINLEDSNEINLTVNRFANLFVGGVIGQLEQINQTVTTENINAGGAININVNQDGAAITVNKDSKGNATNNAYNLLVGGFIGENKKDYSPKNIIINTDINYVEEKLHISDEPAITTLTTRIGGIFGFATTSLKDALYTGDINVTQGLFEVINEGDVTFNHRIQVGGYAGYLHGTYVPLTNLVRSNSTITVLEIDANRPVKLGSIVGDGLSDIDTTNFNFNGNVLDQLNDITVTTEIDFITNISDVLTSDWYKEQLN